jgi:hypothetical protein
MLARFVVFAVVAVGAVACGGAEDSAKKPLPVCDAKDSDCPGIPSSAPKTPKTEIPTDPVPGPPTTTDQSQTQPAPPADAGASVDAAPAVGMLCQKLAACCKQLADAGYHREDVQQRALDEQRGRLLHAARELQVVRRLQLGRDRYCCVVGVGVRFDGVSDG